MTLISSQSLFDNLTVSDSQAIAGPLISLTASIMRVSNMTVSNSQRTLQQGETGFAELL